MATGAVTEVGDMVAVLPETATATGLEGAGRSKVWHMFVSHEDVVPDT